MLHTIYIFDFHFIIFSEEQKPKRATYISSPQTGRELWQDAILAKPAFLSRKEKHNILFVNQ